MYCKTMASNIAKYGCVFVLNYYADTNLLVIVAIAIIMLATVRLSIS